MKRPSMSTILKSKPFLASAACILIILAFAVVSPRGVLAGVPNQSFVFTNGISETFTGKTASLDLGACPETFCELRVGGSATLNSGHSSNGTIGQFSVTLRGGTDNFYFPANTPNGLRQATTAPSSEDESHHDGNNHEGYNFVLPPQGPFFLREGEHVFLRFTSTSNSGGELQGTANGAAIFKATAGKKIVGLQMPGTVGLLGAGMLGLAGLFGALTLKHIVMG
jgi:hypothetical protein